MIAEIKENPLHQEMEGVTERYLGLLQKEINILDSAILREPNQKKSDQLKSYRRELEDVIGSVETLEGRAVFGSKDLAGLTERGNAIIERINTTITPAKPLEVLPGGGQEEQDAPGAQKKIA